jgi:voltage-gated potassium channel
MLNSKKRIIASLSILIIVFLIGVAGFKFLGGPEWSLLDSIYMTAITIATIGYEEVNDLSANPAARVFAVFFIIVCLGTIAYVVSSITAFVVEGELKNLLGRRKMEKEIAKLKGHYIVCGSDETAVTIIQELILTKREFVVIESSKEKIEKLAGLGSLLAIQGDPSEDNILLQAGIERARGVLLSLPSDEANLFVTITARSLSPGIRIVTKVMDINNQKKMMKAGADSFISPTYIGGMRMVSEMVRPAVVTFLDMMLRDREKVLRFEEVQVKQGSAIKGKTVAGAKLGEKTGALLVAIKRSGALDYMFNPGHETVIQAGDILIFIGSPESEKELEKIAG